MSPLCPLLRHEHRDDWLLAPDFVCRSADRATDSFSDKIQVAPALPRNASDRADRGIQHNILHEASARIHLGDANRYEVRIARKFVMVIQHDIHRHVSGIAELAPVTHADLVVVADDLAVLEDAAGSNLIDDLDWPRRKAKHVAIAHLR